MLKTSGLSLILSLACHCSSSSPSAAVSPQEKAPVLSFPDPLLLRNKQVVSSLGATRGCRDCTWHHMGGSSSLTALWLQIELWPPTFPSAHIGCRAPQKGGPVSPTWGLPTSGQSWGWEFFLSHPLWINVIGSDGGGRCLGEQAELAGMPATLCLPDRRKARVPKLTRGRRWVATELGNGGRSRSQLRKALEGCGKESGLCSQSD